VTTYDAIVVGAGPAGASAAHVLSEGGARVLLLEKAALPRYKPCGGGLTARARAASPLAAAFTPETIAGTVHIAGANRAVDCALPAAIGMTMRPAFDAYLVDRAVASGATLRDETSLTALETDGRRVRLQAGADIVSAAYIVGADGANGVTARLAGFPMGREPATAIEAEVAVPDAARARYEDAALLDFAVAPRGYAWIFGKGDHLSVGVYTVDPGMGRALRPALARFLAGRPDLRAGAVLLQRGHRAPLAGGREIRRRGAVVLAGDAAALADPLTGEGISYALASGRRAGTAVLSALAGDDGALAAYDRYLARDLCGDLRYARIVAAVAYRLSHVAVRLTVEHAGLRDVAAAAVSGTLDYRSLITRLASRAPQLLRYAV